MRVLDIIEGTAVDGPGLRTSIYFAGCTHRCPGCHNPQSWDRRGGTEMSVADILAVVEEASFDVTFSGGDPLLQIDSLIELARKIKALGLNIWCYTGFTYEHIETDPRLRPLLSVIDALVDGPFDRERKDPGLRFRGSSNQRIFHFSDGKIVKVEKND